jgi:N-acetylglucosaminyldiphosphoundecaprenol N-acetyl-beta-D-mannosaminyltransferase
VRVRTPPSGALVDHMVSTISYQPSLPAAAQPPLPTVPLMGLEFAAISELQAIEHLISQLEDGRGGWVCPVNLDVLRQWRASADVRKLVAEADLVVADGMPLIWASVLQGTPLPERVAGSTMTVTLTAAAADTGASVFLLGGSPGTADRAARELMKRSPGMRLAGTLCPPFGFERDQEWLDQIRETLAETQPDLVFVGLGFPKQERLISELRDVLPCAWFVSCGVSFSFVAGDVRRAPTVVQRLGLEWLHRMVQEPRRLCRRYLVDGIPFLVWLLSWSLAARGRRVPAITEAV